MNFVQRRKKVPDRSRVSGIRAAVGTAVVLILLAACGGSPAQSPGKTAASAEIALGAPKDGNVSAELALANSLGYFADEGLNVAIRYFPSAGDLSTAVASGSINIGAGGTTPTTTLRASGFPAIVLAQLADISGAQQVVVGGDIRTAADLKGRKIGVALGTVSELLGEQFLAKNGLTRNDVAFVNLGATDMITALNRGDVAAAAMWEPHASRAVAQGAHRLASGTTNFVGGQPSPQRLVGDHAVLFATESWANDNASSVKKIITALQKATKYIESDGQDAKKRIGEVLGLQPNEVDNTFSVNKYQMQIDDQLVGDMVTEAQFLVAKKKVSKMLMPKEWVRTNYLAAVAPNLVTWQP